MSDAEKFECTVVADRREHNLVVLDAAGALGGQIQLRVAKDDARFVVGSFYTVDFAGVA